MERHGIVWLELIDIYHQVVMETAQPKGIIWDAVAYNLLVA